MHRSVLQREVIEWLRPEPGQRIVDATFGAGGHTAAFLERLGPLGQGGKVIGLDRDTAAIDAGSHRYAQQINSGQLVLVQARFSELANVLQELGVGPIDALLFDFGVSSDQLLSPTRGFSFMHDAPLDMRMDQREDFTAARLLAEWSTQELRDLFTLVGERRNAARLARTIVQTRRERPLQTTGELVQLIEQVLPRHSKQKIHLATKVFMGLRIAVNHELEQVEQGLVAGLAVLRPGGRLAAISFHSLEDQIVKRTFRLWARDCVCPPELPVCRCEHRRKIKILTPRPIRPSIEERGLNPRSRSASLRVCEKL